MLRTIYWFTAFWVIQFICLFKNLKYKSILKNKGEEEAKEYLSNLVTEWAKTMVKNTNSDIEVIGVENIPDETVLFVSNHQGNFDIPLLLGYLPKLKGFIAKKELENLPLVSSWMKRINCIFMDRSNPRASIKSIKEGVELLKEGKDLVIFPEGTRSKSGQLGEFKKGSLKLATKAKVPIVPITIDGSYKMLEETKRIKRSKVRIIVHQPIRTDDITKEEERDLINVVQGKIEDGLVTVTE